MHRIDTSTATPDNRFTEGNPTIPVPATTVSADWLNAVQEEIANVVFCAGLTLSKSDNSQLWQAISMAIRQAIAASRQPIQRASWLLSDAVPQGETLPLPEGMRYVPGHGALCLSVDGVHCHQGRQFEELTPDEDSYAHGIRLLFGIPAGSEVEVLIHGHGNASSGMTDGDISAYCRTPSA